MEFYLNNDAKYNGCSFKDTIKVSPKRLIRMFGLPGEDEGHKVSGIYVFVSEKKEVFTVYDWQETSLYHPTLMPFREFWRQEEDVLFHIGAKTHTKYFKRWLENKIKLNIVQEIKEQIKKEYHG